MFSLFNFSFIFQGGSADPICPYVRTPMQQFRNKLCNKFQTNRSNGVYRVTADQCVINFVHPAAMRSTVAGQSTSSTVDEIC